MNLSTTDRSLSGYGWNDGWASKFSLFAGTDLRPGRVTRVDRGLCDVFLDDDGSGAPGTVRADLRPVRISDPAEWVCTGDWVGVDLTTAPLPSVAAVLPRTTAIVRSTAGKRSEGQVLAANVDTVMIAVSLAADPDLGRIERFVALAWESGAEPLVVLTKSDLVGDADFVKDDVEGVAPGVTVLAVSAETGEGIDVLRACLGTTSALIGQSGAGKSTLTNALSSSESMVVQATRSVDEKGRHTTTTREMIPLPGGGVVIDTPGLRGAGLFGGEGLAVAFAEIEELAADCRFHDCRHAGEPGCAVRAALEEGTLPVRRWESYQKLQKENLWIASRTDARLAAERLKKWKTITKSVRANGSPKK
ncbi:ribosome small subunit-dependent GTPase A [Kitasatospora sp. NPDC051853]|uniref:ribosome small subunit-dependent GTPase A n=1 Tax=Kitasatospora sp. NPDC051853 TaxID=3364058 RepID=UPI00379085D6